MVALMVISPVRAHRDAMVRCLEAEPDLRVVHAGASVADAVAGASAAQPSVTLFDFQLAEVAACLTTLRRVAPASRLIGYGVGHAQGTGETVISAARAGARSFVDADQSLADIVDVVRAAARGEPYCSPRVAGMLLLAIQTQPAGHLGSNSHVPDGASALTSRERVVAEMVIAGLTNRQIAQRLVLGEATVKSHVHSILSKLGVSRRSDVRYCLAQNP